jgi:hypothetical protein
LWRTRITGWEGAYAVDTTHNSIIKPGVLLKDQESQYNQPVTVSQLRIPDFWIWRQKPKALRISRPVYLEIDTKREERDKGVSGAVEFGACGGNLARNINIRTQMSKPTPEEIRSHRRGEEGEGEGGGDLPTYGPKETESAPPPPVAALRMARATKAAMDAGVAPVRSSRKTEALD